MLYNDCWFLEQGIVDIHKYLSTATHRHLPNLTEMAEKITYS